MDDKSGEQFTDKMNGLFPSIDEKIKEPLIDVFAELLISFEAEINKRKYLKYLNDMPENSNKSEYLSKIPDGVRAFELWLNDGLLDISKNILLRLEEIMPSSICYIYFSLLLENQNFDEYFNKVNFPPELKSEFIAAYSELFTLIEYKPFIQSIACACIGLHNSATTSMKVFIQNIMLGDTETYKLINEAKKIEIEAKKASKDSLVSNNLKHSKNRLIHQHTIKLYAALTNGPELTIKKASQLILDEVIAYSKDSNEVKNAEGLFEFVPKSGDTERAKMNIRSWISKYRNKTKEQL